MQYREERPWGHFEVLTQFPGYKVKRLVVRHGGSLSLQSHKFRSEVWTVVEGLATVTLGERTFKLKPKDCVEIGIGQKHRLESLDGVETTVIEVQFGENLSEDDITRFEDVYKRC